MTDSNNIHFPISSIVPGDKLNKYLLTKFKSLFNHEKNFMLTVKYVFYLFLTVVLPPPPAEIQ